MTKFRPCIDLHSGQVKQIVGGTLSDAAESLKTNYVSKLPARHYAKLYQKHHLRGGHVVKLGPGNDEAAQEALQAWPGGLQVAGGITDKNAEYWIEQGAEKVSFCPHCNDPEPKHRDVEMSSLLAMTSFCENLPCSTHVANHSSADRGTIGDHHFIPLPLGQVLTRTTSIRSFGPRW